MFVDLSSKLQNILLQNTLMNNDIFRCSYAASPKWENGKGRSKNERKENQQHKLKPNEQKCRSTGKEMKMSKKKLFENEIYHVAIFSHSIILHITGNRIIYAFRIIYLMRESASFPSNSILLILF